MKRKNKILITLILTFSLFTILAIGTFAAEDGTVPAPDIAEEKNAFELFFDTALENADKIFSLLAFSGTVLVAFAYKKGLFPFVEKALSALSGSVKKLREEINEKEKLGEGVKKELENKLSECDGLITSLREGLASLDEKLGTYAENKNTNESVKAIMLAEVEMLYEIFMSSSLPQYQKDRVGECFSRMKSALDGNGDEK